jgi:hypothetical protein
VGERERKREREETSEEEKGRNLVRRDTQHKAAKERGEEKGPRF